MNSDTIPEKEIPIPNTKGEYMKIRTTTLFVVLAVFFDEVGDAVYEPKILIVKNGELELFE